MRGSKIDKSLWIASAGVLLVILGVAGWHYWTLTSRYKQIAQAKKELADKRVSEEDVAHLQSQVAEAVQVAQ